MFHDPLADFDTEIRNFLASCGVEDGLIQLSTPTDRTFGERATNVAFRLARERKQSPRSVAEELSARFQSGAGSFVQAVEPAGAGFINFRLDYDSWIPHALAAMRQAGELYGRKALTKTRVVVEHTSVNPNKEWHIGHVRNAVLGDVTARLLRLAGYDVQVQNYIDDTGVQAAQSIVGLRDFPEERQPGEKFDHYAGRLYVKISAELGAEKDLMERLAEVDRKAGESPTSTFDERTQIESRLANIKRLQKTVVLVMHQLEESKHHDLIEKILGSQLETAYRLGVFYDLLNWESHLVQSHLFRDAVRKLEQSSEVRRPDSGRYAGALVIQTGPPLGESEESKCEVLIRTNGLPTYVGKDIAYHMWKFGVLPDPLKYVEFTVEPNGRRLLSTSLRGATEVNRKPDRVINVIGVNQSLAQEAVKTGLRVTGFVDQADALLHLAYGLVSTSEGRISGRKGTTVSADSVIDEAVRVAHERAREKSTQHVTEDASRATAEAVGIGALRYFMVQYNPTRDIVFDVANVVNYDGNTGLYIQYALVRISAILRKAELDSGITTRQIDEANASLLRHEQEKRLVFHLGLYPDLVETAARTLAVNLVAEYAYDLATIFSQFYRDCSVLSAELGLREARLLLIRTVHSVLVGVCNILGVPAIERL